MKVFGQLENASIEQLATDPATSTQGRVFTNTTSGKTKIDDGTNKRALIRNDQKAIFGNDPVEANNVRIHKGPTGVIQTAGGADVTAEGSTPAVFGQLGMRYENVLSSSMPAAGNVGRKVFVTDQKVDAVDDGTNWRKSIAEFSIDDSTTGGTVQLAVISSSVVRLTASITTVNMIPAGFNSQRVILINRSGGDISVSHDNGATAANRIFTGTGAVITFKSNSSLPLQYDSTTQRWQVIGDAASGASGAPISNVVNVSSNHTCLLTEDIFLIDTTAGNIDMTLPSAAGNSGKRFLFEKIVSANTVNVLGTINGVVNHSFSLVYGPYEVVSDGSAWKSISAPDTSSTRQVFTAAGTWVKPSGLKYAIVTVVGGGGGSGGINNGNTSCTGGGGGGSTRISAPILAASLGSSETVTIGSGGTAGTSAPTSGGTGGETKFGAVPLISAVGGTGSAGISAGNISQAGVGGGAGGTSLAGSVLIPGSDGFHAAFVGGSHSNGGAGGSSYLSGSRQGAIRIGSGGATAGNAGLQYGGGAGGASVFAGGATSTSGAAGASGIIIVDEYY